jgi:endonuclease/exonuclease/phosphatase family metal-dependent hydrolase
MANVGFASYLLLIFYLLFPGEKDVVILGDFGQGPDSNDYDILRREKFHHLVPAHTFTNISTRNPQGSKSVDNIWISKSLKKVFTGRRRLPCCLCSVLG